MNEKQDMLDSKIHHKPQLLIMVESDWQNMDPDDHKDSMSMSSNDYPANVRANQDLCTPSGCSKSIEE
jgi:hypothetical protein